MPALSPRGRVGGARAFAPRAHPRPAHLSPAPEVSPAPKSSGRGWGWGTLFFCRGGSWKREATRRPGGWLHPSPGAPRVFWGAGCGRGIREVSAQKAERNSATPPSLPPPSPPPPLRARSSSFKPGRPEWCQLSPGRRRARKWPRSRSRR